MKITRHFTLEGQSPYADIPFRAAFPAASAAESAPARPGPLQVPAAFSQAAIDMLAQCACLRGVPARLKKNPENGVPEWLWLSSADEAALAGLDEAERFAAETDARRIFDRISGAITYWGWKNGHFDSEKDARIFRDELCFMLAAQRAAPNAAQWREMGRHWAYGLDEPAAMPFYYADQPGGEVKPDSAGSGRIMPFAAVLHNPAANAGSAAASALDYGRLQAQLAPYAVACAGNFSDLTGDIAELLALNDKALNLAAREAAAAPAAGCLAALAADHADIQAFLRAGAQKQENQAAETAGRILLEKHAAALLQACGNAPGAAPGTAACDPAANPQLARAIAAAEADFIDKDIIRRLVESARQGWGKSLLALIEAERAARRRAPAKNRNKNAAPGLAKAVILPQDFLRAVEKDDNWQLNCAAGGTEQPLKARALWDEIARAFWAGSIDSLHFSAAINEWHAAPSAGPIEAASPDASFLFINNSAAPAVLFNLAAFTGEKNRFDTSGFIYAVRLWTLAADIAVSAAHAPSPAVCAAMRDYRPVCLGYANLAPLLIAMGLPYDSDAARAFCAGISALLGGAAMVASAEIAAEAGAFKHYAANAHVIKRLIRNRRRAVYGQVNGYERLSVNPLPLRTGRCPDTELAELARAAWDKALRLADIYGFRNAQLTALPADNIAAGLMDCDSLGLDPEETLVKFKKRPDGSAFKVISRAVPQALQNLDYPARQIAEIIAYATGSASLENAPGINTAALAAKGFSPREIGRIQAALPNITALSAAFTPEILGPEFCRRLGFSAGQMAEADFNMLAALGFAADDIAAAEDFACGMLSLRGAPHLRAEHYAIFACAKTPGRLRPQTEAAAQSRAEDRLSVESHMRMTAAAQAFLDGGIGKITPLPAEASAEDCAKASMLAWKMGLKTVALRREADSRPLLSPAEMQAAQAAAAADKAAAEAAAADKAAQAVITAQNGAVSGAPLKAEREHLPDRRSGYTQRAIIRGHKIYLRSGEFKDGRLGEVFIDMPQEGAAFRAVMSNFAAAVSLGLQYGVPLEEFVKVFALSRFEPAGIVSGSDKIKNASSILDYIFRELAVSYLDRADLADINVSDHSETALGRPETPEAHILPAGWKHGFRLKSNIIAGPARAAAGGEPAAAGENKEAAAVAPHISARSDTARESRITAAGRTILAEAGRPAAKTAFSPAGGETARAEASAEKQRRAAPPLTPFSNPDYFTIRPADPLPESGAPAAAETVPANRGKSQAPAIGAAAAIEADQTENQPEHSLIEELFGDLPGRPIKTGADSAAEAAADKKPVMPLAKITASAAAGQRHIQADREKAAAAQPAVNLAVNKPAQIEAETGHRPAAPTAGPAEAAPVKTAESAPDKSRATVKPAENHRAAEAERPAAPAQAGRPAPADDSPYRAKPAGRAAQARLNGYSGDICPECHNYTMLRNGDFLKCDSCGAIIRAKPEKDN